MTWEKVTQGLEKGKLISVRKSAPLYHHPTYPSSHTGRGNEKFQAIVRTERRASTRLEWNCDTYAWYCYYDGDKAKARRTEQRNLSTDGTPFNFQLIDAFLKPQATTLVENFPPSRSSTTLFTSHHCESFVVLLWWLAVIDEIPKPDKLSRDMDVWWMIRFRSLFPPLSIYALNCLLFVYF